MMRTFLIGCVFPVTAAFGAGSDTGPGDVGLERAAKVLVLPRADYSVAPQDDGTALLLTIDSVTPKMDGGYAYAIRSLGFESGEYRLADYLVHPDGTAASELGDLSLKVAGLLPADHNGKLNTFAPVPTPWFGGYKAALITSGCLWLAALPALVLMGRKRKVVAAVVPPAPEPGRVERMRPLVQAAAEGRLDLAGRAELERLILGHSRETARMAEGRVAESIAAMRRHPEYGPLLLALERWLHAPEGASPGEIDAMLAPYGRSPGGSGDGGAA